MLGSPFGALARFRFNLPYVHHKSILKLIVNFIVMIWGKRVRENTLSFFLNQKNGQGGQKMQTISRRAVVSVRSIQ